MQKQYLELFGHKGKEHHLKKEESCQLMKHEGGTFGFATFLFFKLIKYKMMVH